MGQSLLYLRYIHGRPDGHRLSVLTMRCELEGMDSLVRFPEEAVRSWLSGLVECGIVRRVKSRYRHDRWPKYRVAAREEAPTREGAHVPRKTYLTVEELAERGVKIERPGAMTRRGRSACAVCGDDLKAESSKQLGCHTGFGAGLNRQIE